MARTKYFIRLTDEERNLLNKIISDGMESERTIMRAKILLMSDATQPEKVSIKKLAKLLGTTDTTIQTVRTEYASDGVESAVYRKKRVVSRTSRKINDDVIRQILEIAQSEPPEGHKRWSSRMLCEAAMERGIVDHIGQSAVCKILRGEEW